MIKLNKSASDTRLCTMSPKKRFATLNFLGEFPGFFPIFCSAWFFLCLCILLPLCVFVLCPHLYVPGCSISRRRWSCQSSWGWQNPREKLRRTRFYTPNSTRDNNICSESRSRAAHMYIVHTVWSFTLGSSSHWNYEYWPSAPLPSIFTMLRKLHPRGPRAYNEQILQNQCLTFFMNIPRNLHL